VPAGLHGVVKRRPLHGVNELCRRITARIVSVLKNWRIQYRCDEGLYRIVKALSVHDPNGAIVIQQIERDRDNGGVEIRYATLFRPASGHGVEPSATRDSGRANSRRLKIAGEGLDRIERGITIRRDSRIG